MKQKNNPMSEQTTTQTVDESQQHSLMLSTTNDDP